jgi:hypothetical protein
MALDGMIAGRGDGVNPGEGGVVALTVQVG